MLDFKIPDDFGNDWHAYREALHFVAKPVDVDFRLAGVKGKAGDYIVVPSNGEKPFVCPAAEFNRRFTPFGPAKSDTHFGH